MRTAGSSETHFLPTLSTAIPQSSPMYRRHRRQAQPLAHCSASRVPLPIRGCLRLAWARLEPDGAQVPGTPVNEVVKIVEYQSGGLTDDSLKLQIRTPIPIRQFFLEELQLPHRLSLRRRLRSYANYTRFSLHARLGVREQAREAPSTASWVLVVPLGTILYIRDRLRFAEPSSLLIG
jgi:hypothetical protein